MFPQKNSDYTVTEDADTCALYFMGEDPVNNIILYISFYRFSRVDQKWTHLTVSF